MNRHHLSLALGTILVCGAAHAQSPAPRIGASAETGVDREATRRELDAAKRELERASSRLAALTQMLARDEIEAALASNAFDRPMIGVVLAGDEAAGVRLAAVTPKGPAAEAGLRSGDRLLRIRGKAIAGASADERLANARAAIGELAKGESVGVSYERAGRTHEVTLTAAAMPGMAWWRGEDFQGREMLRHLQPSLPKNFLMDLGQLAPMAACSADGVDCMFEPMAEAYRWRGLRLAALEARLGRYFGTDHGVLVLTSPEDELKSLEPGDVLLRVDGTAVELPQEVMRRLRDKAPGESIAIEFLRDRKRRNASVEAPAMARFPLFVPPPPPAPPAPPASPAPAAVPSAARLPTRAPPPPPPSPPAVPATPPPPDDDRAFLIRSPDAPESSAMQTETRRGVIERVLQH